MITETNMTSEESNEYSESMVLLCHGLTSSKNSSKLYHLSSRLEQMGIAAQRFDFTGHGENKGSIFWDLDLDRQVKDINLQVERQKQELPNVSNLILYGSSLGATAAFLYTSANPANICGLIMSAPRFDFPLRDFYRFPRYWVNQSTHNFPHLARRINAPVMLIKAENDELVDNTLVDNIFYELASSDKSVVVIPNASHSIAKPEEIELLVNLTVEWITNHLNSGIPHS